eukprot:CAMPEP_0114604594 /NCGR_PEP_ID=MMETSP0168-20121206/626_1 /TAXON_ID=95228 ORGANISM="Vannella sp., Strain DIVA3 517/6/12" /NCGR_SAMPLE_ID=MMETSP0168 /ASSEMBLY_ACC=CAM_ASM_000044 /LENGTH=237 /DNA_ID=CAMNT_0001815431 /DNA_START=45 /DNA_END=758 /DNA_ORIENTATION=-
MTRNSQSSRNKPLARSVGVYSRSAMIKKRGAWAKKADQWKAVEKKQDSKAVVTKDFCGGKRTIAEKGPRFYPAEDIKAPVRRAFTPTAARLRGSITPGTVLVLLAGRFRGKRVVFLRQLASGLLLVTGPFKINGVPVRRVNQAYVIATSTKVDISKVEVPAKFDDAYFKAPKNKGKSGKFFDKESKEANVISAERVSDQKALDAKLLPAIKAVPHLRDYLNAKFSLKQNQFPHLMKF